MSVPGARAYPGPVDDGEVEELFEDDASPPVPAVPPVPVRRRRANGLIAAGLLGIEQALYGVRRNEIVVVADADGMPEPDFEIYLTPDPRDATVVVRRHRNR